MGLSNREGHLPDFTVWTYTKTSSGCGIDGDIVASVVVGWIRCTGDETTEIPTIAIDETVDITETLHASCWQMILDLLAEIEKVSKAIGFCMNEDIST